MSCYEHLTIIERERLLQYKAEGKSIRAMAKVMGRSPSTISREFNRNDPDYLPIMAQKRYEEQRKKCVRKFKLLKYEHLRSWVHFFLVYCWWSPEQIAHRLSLEGIMPTISTSTIYRAFENGCLRPKMSQHLRIKGDRTGKHKRNKASFITRTIHERPPEAARRERRGDFEGDLVLVPRQGKAIFTCVDRNNRYLLAGLTDKKPGTVVKLSERLLSSLPKEQRLTITLDRGPEFEYMNQLEDRIGVTAYFCDPYKPRQRATNENTNGILRQFFPKQNVTFPLTDETLSRFVSLINLRPRKCLGWRVPYEVFFDNVLHFT